MTACNDVQSASFGKKVVGTALAGTLAVGMVPAAALAAPADEAAVNDGISALALSGTEDFDAGSVTGLVINGKTVAVNKGVAAVIKTGEAQTLKVTQVTTGQGTVLNAGEDTWTVKYSTVDPETATDSDWTALADGAFPATASEYWIQVAAGTGLGDNYTGGKIVFKVEVQAASLDGVFACGAKVTDTTFTYNGAAQTFNFALPGQKAPLAAADIDVTWYEGTGPNATLVGADGKTAPTAAGSYTAVVTGTATNNYQGKVSVPVTINKLDLSKAEIVVSDITAPATSFAISSIAGVADTATLSDIATLDCTSSPNNMPGFSENGAYTFTVSPAKDNKSVTGTATVTANRVNSSTVVWAYGDIKATANANNAALYEMTIPEINLQAGNAAFDISKLVAGTQFEGATTTIATANQLAYTYTVTDAKGNVVAADSLTKPGEWNVTAKIDSAAAANDYKYGATLKFTVNVVAGTINSTDIIVKQDGKVTAEPTFTYDGTDVLPGLDVTVKCGNATLVKGTDYTLEVSKGSETGLTEIVNAGDYTVTVKAPGYKFADADDAQFTVSVDAIAPTAFRIAGQTANVEGQTPAEFLPYTGEAIVPIIEYTTAKDPASDKAEWTALPTDIYSLKYTLSDGAATPTFNAVDEMKAAGDYKVEVELKSDVDAAANYDISSVSNNPIEVAVAQGVSKFQDVPSTAWFYTVVNQANENGYMNGYAGTKLFGPNDKITRGQVACVLFNMAGGKAGGVEDDSFTDNEGFKTGFSDVDDHAYYAQAIAWAKQAGVVNGYAGTDKFGPNDNVTREQFAAMLANYAKATNKFVAVEDVAAVLDARPDGATVSDWAEESVAWAVSNKYMGNAADGVINPLGNITRAEVAAMAVNFQPTKLA